MIAGYKLGGFLAVSSPCLDTVSNENLSLVNKSE